MARGSYLSENLTQAQINLMLLLEEHEMDLFSLDDVKELAGDTTTGINESVENLVHKKILSRIERGK